MNRDKLKRIVEDIEATEKSIKDLSAHKRDVYSGVKDEFDAKVLRKIIARRKMDPESRTRDDDLLDEYETALGMTGKLAKAAASGEMTYQEAADEASVSRRTMARHVARANRVPKTTDDGATIDPTTGEITETAELEAPPGEGSVRADINAASGASLANLSCGGGGSASILSVTGSSGTSPKSEREPDPQDPVCVIPDSPDPCPNTCAREGRCAWDGKPATDMGIPMSATVVLGAVAEGESPQRVAGTDYDPGPIPDHLRRVRPAA